MRKLFVVKTILQSIGLCFLSVIMGCAMELSMNNGQELYLTEYPPRDTPVHFKPELIPEGQLAHAGVFTPDQNEYYYTLSDASFSQFTVMFITNLADQWTAPKEAFFNSSYLEHGVHFTADGQWVYFSSTRPVEKEEFSSVWHIWRSKKLENGWSDPEWVAIPGMETKSTSHPSLVRSGRMYFHSSNPDFSDMALYVTEPAMGVFTKAKKIVFPEGANHNTFTPFVAQDESYILFGKKFDDFREHELYISFRDQNAWQVPRRLHDNINTNNLGNPYVTPDGQYLFYASGHWSLNAPPYDWVIKWVSTKSVFAQ